MARADDSSLLVGDPSRGVVGNHEKPNQVELRHCNFMSTNYGTQITTATSRPGGNKAHCCSQPRPGLHSNCPLAWAPTTQHLRKFSPARLHSHLFGEPLHLRVGSCMRMHGLGCRGSGVTDVDFSTIASAARTHKTWRAQCVCAARLFRPGNGAFSGLDAVRSVRS